MAKKNTKDLKTQTYRCLDCEIIQKIPADLFDLIGDTTDFKYTVTIRAEINEPAIINKMVFCKECDNQMDLID